MNCRFSVILALTFVTIGDRAAHADEIDSQGEYIVNGEPTEAGDIRGTVAILRGSEGEALDDVSRRTLAERLRCTGVLMSPSVVITAAHCYSDSLYVAAGLRTLDDVWTAEIRSVRELVAHETRDVMLLVLDSPLTMVTPVAILPADETLVGEAVIAQGYGRRVPLDYEGPLGQEQYESLLNKAVTPVEHVDDNWVVTAEGTNRSGTCFGDSGGPLYVERGNELFVAGIASSLLPNDEGPECGAGAIYVSAPPQIDWIVENNPETVAAVLGGGGGCSASPRTPAPHVIWLAGMLAVLLFLRARARALAIAVVFLLAAPTTGCGSDGAPDFCSDPYDPTGDFCDPSIERIDLRTAEKRARDLMPSEAWLWSAVGGSEGTVNPDGEAEAWFLQYYIPGQLELPDVLLRSVTIDASEEARAFQEIGISRCVPTKPMVPLDSQVMVHDAIRRLEQAGVSVRLGEEGLLRVVQRHRCAREPDEWSGVGFANTFLYYDDDGSYLGMEKTQ